MSSTRPSRKLKIIVSGLVAQYPLGGVAWDYLQYVLGLRQLGHDVYYLEDTAQWPFNPLEGGVSKGPDFNVRFLSEILQRYHLEDKWAYCFPHESQWFGLPDEERERLISTADVLINVSGTLADPERYRTIPNLIYIDSDPVFTQIKLARGQEDFRKLIDTHDIHFTFGECFSEHIPDTGHEWIPTRQPVVMSEWRHNHEDGNAFTTVMNWTSHNDVNYNGRSYGQKDREFKKFIDLPGAVPTSQLELAVNAGKTRRTPYDLLRHKGWQVVDPDQVCPDFDSYRHYIQSSKAEWSVAKNGYVQGQPGWFSCRSACYLAAGRPVVVQDTGFTKVLPHGRGIIAFKTFEEAVDAINEVEAHYEDHCQAAQRIANEYFDSNKVLADLLNRTMSKNFN